MWRWNASVVVLILVLTQGQASVADDAEPSLVVQQQWTHFEVVLGRITAFHLRGGQSHCSSSQAPGSSRQSISVNADPAALAFRYERFDPQGSLTIEIANRAEVEIRQQTQTKDEQTSILFSQPANGTLRVKINQSGAEHRYAARSLWHLLLAHPEVSQRHLVPILAVLRPNWRLVERSQQIEAELFDFTEGRPAISQRDVMLSVSQLDSGQFSLRQAADRQLRSFGVGILPYLSKFDAGTLSVEQRLRLKRIRADLAVPTADTPERVAAWLSNDNAVWLALMSDEDPSKREAATNRLTRIHPGVIQFDPHAEEAERSKQLVLLRSRLGAAVE